MDNISLYQVETIRKNIVKGIVKMSIVNEELKYNMNGLRPLKRHSFFKIIQIVDIIKRAGEFFLYEKNFILDNGNIHIDKKGAVSLLYIPVKEYKAKTMNLDALVCNNVRIKYLQNNMLEYIRSDHVSYMSFNLKKAVYVLMVFVFSLLLALVINKAFLLAAIPPILIPVLIPEGRKPVVREQTYEKTVILSDREKITVCFSDIFGNEKSICISEHENKYVGRDDKECSLYICNSAVGRKHAKLSFIDGKVLITDNDSLNNTYINSQKLKKHRQYEVNDGDRVVFANEEYMLFLRK
jgi:hypothetical protein